MGIPSSQVCAAWVKADLVATEWVLLHDFCVTVVRARLQNWTDGQVHEYVEQNLAYVAEHLRDEAGEWHIDGRVPQFEIDDEQAPYIRACSCTTRPLLEKLRRIDPFKFEEVCAWVLNKLGANAKTTQRTKDGGVDFVGTGLKIVQGTLGVPSACLAAVVGQAKRYSDGNPIRETQVREFVGAAVLRSHQLRYESGMGPLAPVLFAFWTTSDFDPNAKIYSRAVGLWYMDGETLANYIDHLGLSRQVLELA